MGSGVGTTETGVLEQEGWGDSDVSGNTWWPIAGTESGPSDWRLLRWAPEGCAFFISVSICFSCIFPPSCGPKIWVGLRLSGTWVICLPGWARCHSGLWRPSPGSWAL